VRWIALAGLALHPLALDFSIAARGYGLALAFLVWGIWAQRRGSSVLTGVLLGLAVSANLTMAFPALAVLVCARFLFRERAKAAAAAALVFAAVCVPLLRDASPDKFYAGLPTLQGSALEMTWASIRSIVDSPGLFGTPPAAEWIVRWLLPLLIVELAIQAWRREPDEARRVLLMFLVTIGGLFAAKHLFGVLYPVNRTGLYVPILFGLAWAFGADRETSSLRWVHGALALALVAQFATQSQTNAFYVWPYDRDTKMFLQMLKERTAGLPEQSVSISAVNYQQPTIEFYRKFLDVKALQPVEWTSTPALTGKDYYFIHSLEKPVDETSYRVLFRDKLVGMYLMQGR
jgi:hypothetical protein